jgi:hypothetical protein
LARIDAGDRSRVRPRRVDDSQAHRRGAHAQLGQPVPVELDRGVGEGLGERRAVVAQAGEDRQRQRSGPGAVLQQHERGGPAETLPCLGDLPGQCRPEDRVQLGRGQSRRRRWVGPR